MQKMLKYATAVLAVSFLLFSGCTQVQKQKKPDDKAEKKSEFVLDENTRNFDQKHILLDLAFDIPNHSLTGRCRITLSPTVDDLHTLVLHSENLSIDWVTVGGTRANFTVNDEDHLLTIALDRGYDRSDELTVDVRYTATPRKGLFFFHPSEQHPELPVMVWSQGESYDNRCWFPCYDLPDDRQTSELFVTVPGNLTVISNGTRLETTETGKDLETHHWKMSQEHPSYLVSLIIGDYEEVRDVRDSHYNYGYYVPKGMAGCVERVYGRTHDVIKFFESYTGQPYAYEKYDQTVVWNFTFGGMENTTATTLHWGTLYDEHCYPIRNSDGLIAHEAAHQWFGDLLTCRNFDHISQNEGFATYFTDLWIEHYYGSDEFLVDRYHSGKSYMRGATMDYLEKLELMDKDFSPVELSWKTNFGNAYSRGSCLLHMLRYVLGDEAFQKSVQLYVQKHRNQAVTTEDWRLALEEASGQSLKWFFDQWYYKGVGFPEFAVSWTWDAEKSEAVLAVRQTQRMGGKFPIFRTPVQVELDWQDGKHSQRIEIDKAGQEFRFACPAKPRMVIFDKGGWLLKKLDFQKPLEEWTYQAQHGDALDRFIACEELAKQGVAAVETLAAVAVNDQFWRVRQQAVESLDAIRRGPTVAKLLNDLRSRGDISEELVKSWGENAPALAFLEIRDLIRTLPDSGTLKPLLDALQDKDPRVRMRAATALSSYPASEVEEPLLQRLREDENYFVQGSAAWSLAVIQSEKAFPVLQEAMSFPAYNFNIQQDILEGLTLAKDPRVVEMARAFVEKYRDSGYRDSALSTAITALVRLTPDAKDTSDALVKLLTFPDFTAKTDALRHIRRMKLVELVDELEQAKSSQTVQSIIEDFKQTIDELKKWKGEKVDEDDKRAKKKR